MRLRALILCAALALLLWWRGDLPAAGLTHTPVDCTTSSTAGVAGSGTRQWLVVQNDSDTVIYVKLNGTAAALNAGVRLEKDGGAVLFDFAPPKAAITCIHGGSGTKRLLITQVD